MSKSSNTTILTLDRAYFPQPFNAEIFNLIYEKTSRTTIDTTINWTLCRIIMPVPRWHFAPVLAVYIEIFKYAIW